jgi:hypothetical protein
MADTRARIGKQLEKSATPGSVIRTTASNEQEYVAPGTPGQALIVNASNVPEWQDIVGGALVNHTPIAFVPTATGNATNLNEIVTDPDGNVWYIDGNGDAEMIECHEGFKIDTSNLTVASPTVTGTFVPINMYFQGILDNPGSENSVTNPLADNLVTTAYAGFPDPLVDMPLGITGTVTEARMYVNSASGGFSVVTMDVLFNGSVIGTATVNQTAGTVTSIPLSQAITPTDVITLNIYTPDTDNSGDYLYGVISLIYT